MVLPVVFVLQLARVAAALEAWQQHIRRREILEESIACQRARRQALWDAVEETSPYRVIV